MKARNLTSNTQRGASLVIALIFLVLLTLLGVTVANNNSMQERMAGNTRQRNLAFQAAEHALKEASKFMADPNGDGVWVSGDPVTGDPATVDTAYLMQHAIDEDVDGLRDNGHTHGNDRDYWRDCGGTDCWDSDSTDTVAATGLDGDKIDSDPRYIIERMPSATIPNASPPPATKTYYYFRVTARGVGKDPNAVVILQAMYQFE